MGPEKIPRQQLAAAEYLSATVSTGQYEYYLQRISSGQPDLDRLTIYPVVRHFGIVVGNNRNDYHQRELIDKHFLAVAPSLLGTSPSDYPDYQPEVLLANANITDPLIATVVKEYLWPSCQEYFSLPTPPNEIKAAEYPKVVDDKQPVGTIFSLLYCSGWMTLLSESINNVSKQLGQQRPDYWEQTYYWLIHELSSRQMNVIPRPEQFLDRLLAALSSALETISAALPGEISERPAAN